MPSSGALPTTTGDGDATTEDASGDSTTGGGGPKYRDNDGDDPFTAGCWLKYDDSSCNGTPTPVGESCYDGFTGPSLTEYHTDSDCGDYGRKDYNCKSFCMTSNHNSGTCTEVEIACGGQTVTSAVCNCSETPQDHGRWAIEPDGMSPGTAASAIKVWFHDDTCADPGFGTGSERCLDDNTLEEYYVANGSTTVIGSCGPLYSYPVDCRSWCVGKGHDGGHCGSVPVPGQPDPYNVTAVCKCTDESTGSGYDVGTVDPTYGSTTY
jgi:hypothetical protein